MDVYAATKPSLLGRRTLLQRPGLATRGGGLRSRAMLCAIDRGKLFASVLGVIARVDRASCLGHEHMVVVQIVNREKTRTKGLARFEKVVQIGATKSRACAALARTIQ